MKQFIRIPSRLLFVATIDKKYISSIVNNKYFMEQPQNIMGISLDENRKFIWFEIEGSIYSCKTIIISRGEVTQYQ